MPFPAELDSTALRQVLRFVTGADRDIGRLALALWNVAGFALGKAFADPKFLADAITAEPELTEFLTEPNVGDTLAQANGEKLRELLEKYGPALARLLMKLLLKV